MHTSRVHRNFRSYVLYDSHKRWLQRLTLLLIPPPMTSQSRLRLLPDGQLSLCYFCCCPESISAHSGNGTPLWHNYLCNLPTLKFNFFHPHGSAFSFEKMLIMFVWWITQFFVAVEINCDSAVVISGMGRNTDYMGNVVIVIFLKNQEKLKQTSLDLCRKKWCLQAGHRANFLGLRFPQMIQIKLIWIRVGGVWAK